MGKRLRIGILVGVGCLSIVSGLLVVLTDDRNASFFGGSMCGNRVTSEQASPDGQQRVVVFQRGCGATTGFSTHVRILPANAVLPNESGDVFIADVAPALVRAHWQADGSLVVSRPRLMPESIFKQESVVGGVSITYAVRD